jgi:hypothetical protein
VHSRSAVSLYTGFDLWKMYITPNNGSPHLCLKYTVAAAYGRHTVVRVELRVMIKDVARHRRRTDKTITFSPTPSDITHVDHIRACMHQDRLIVWKPVNRRTIKWLQDDYACERYTLHLTAMAYHTSDRRPIKHSHRAVSSFIRISKFLEHLLVV